MTAEAPKAQPSFRDLEEVMTRGLKELEPQASFRSLRLQPVVLPPPPTHETPQPQSLQPVSAQDDIEPDHSGEVKRSINLRLAMAAMLTGVTLIGGWLAYQRSGSREVVSIPEIKALQDAISKTVVPLEAPSHVPVASVPASETSMGQVSTELVPPTTDGLTPARRINTIRILVENDKEVPALR